jgi:hypothetical protein
VEEYTLKKSADDIKELARQLGSPQIILGGHDWYLFPLPNSFSYFSQLTLSSKLSGAVHLSTALRSGTQT